jgi:hypothetical protein
VSYSRAVVIWCDYHDEDKMRFGCYAEFKPPWGTRFDSLAKMRGHAAKQGWVHVRDSSIRALDKDYCPRHKPAEADQ